MDRFGHSRIAHLKQYLYTYLSIYLILSIISLSLLLMYGRGPLKDLQEILNEVTRTSKPWPQRYSVEVHFLCLGYEDLLLSRLGLSW